MMRLKTTGLSEVYFFLHEHDEKNSPLLASHFIERLNDAAGVKLESPTLLPRPSDVGLAK